jgi:hypothetical protein
MVGGTTEASGLIASCSCRDVRRVGAAKRANGLRAASVFSHPRQNSLFPEFNFPVFKNAFPVNFRREFREKTLQCSRFLFRNAVLGS